MAAWLRKFGSQLFALALTLGAAIGIFVFLKMRVPFGGAFAWDVLGLLGYAVYLSAAWFCGGAFVLRGLVGLRWVPPLERVAIAGPLGALVFVLGHWLLGAVHLLGPLVAIAWPAVLIILGAGDARVALKALRASRPARALEWVCFAAGVLMVGMIWLGVLTPDALNYDAKWNHLVIAQDYAREGGIVAFRADWVKNLPHAGSLINTWAFLVPGLAAPALRWMLALQLEFFAVLWTLVGVSAVAARLLGHRAPRSLWSVLVLFPGILVYDSNLGASADHYLALFACPVLLCALHWTRRFDPRWGLLTGAFVGMAFATKLQATFLAAPVAILTAVALVRRYRARLPMRPALRSVLIAAVGAFALMLPHLVRNTIAFHNPLYPMAQAILGGTPSVPDAAHQVRYLFADWRTHPPSELGPLLLGAAGVVATFAFLPHYSFINNLPTFGFLFTVLTPAIAVVRRRRALLPGLLMAYGALATWALLVWVDRNLQTFAPWLWAVTAALCVGIWRLGKIARVGLAALVAVQLAWAVGMYTNNNDRIFAALRLFQTGTTAAGPRWENYQAQYTGLDKSLPADAVVLMHNYHLTLGINRPILLDWIGFQGLFDYRPMTSVADLRASMLSQHVTHVVWVPWDSSAASKQEEVLFAGLVLLAAPITEQHADLSLFPLAALRTPPAVPLHVWSIGVPHYADGLYDLGQLGSCEAYPAELQSYVGPKLPFAPEADPIAFAREAEVVLIGEEGRVPAALRPILAAEFVAVRTKAVTVHYRRTALGL